MPDDGRGDVAHWLDRVFGIGWTKRVARLGSLTQIAILAIATGAIKLEDMNAIHIPFLSDNWHFILGLCLIINKMISWYQGEHQATEVQKIKAEVTGNAS